MRHILLAAVPVTDMSNDAKRQRLVNAVKKRPALMKQRLKHLKRIAKDIRGRGDLLWLLLLQSLSTQGRSAGWTNLTANLEELKLVAYSQLCFLSEDEKKIRLERVLSTANVRYPKKKADLLAKNILKIQKLGGLAKANRDMLLQQGYDKKIKFIRSFHGIGEKYGRNIWMDIYDEDFRQSIAVDSRLNKVGVALGLWEKKCKGVDRETLLKNIAKEAGVDPWDLDRLLYTYTSYFLTEISGFSELPPTVA